MAREPDLVIFTCESCEFQTDADSRTGTHLLAWKRKLPIEPSGHCKSCGGEMWTVSVVYAQSGLDVEASALGIGLAAATGTGFIQTSTSSSQTDYPNVRAAVIAKLNESPPERMLRVAAFATTMEREALMQRGGQECESCGTLFVPNPTKPWSQKGYCSKMCAVKKEGAAGIASDDQPKGPAGRVAGIQVRCPAGHDFAVAASFAGLKRPCPECGEKTIVPTT